MRIRIIRSLPIRGIDGVRLERFVVGQQYEVGNALGGLLVRKGWAEPIDLGPALVIPFTEMTSFRKHDDPRNLIRERNLPYFDWPVVACRAPASKTLTRSRVHRRAKP